MRRLIAYPSMVSLHPFLTSRENVLHVWSPEAQNRRRLPDARVPDLFVLLHGMLFTNIQLDDFKPTFSRFMERLELEGAEEREWIMMATVNIGSLFEYGKANGVLKKAGAPGLREANSAAPIISRIAKKETQTDKMDVDDEPKSRLASSPRMSEMDVDSDEPSLAFKLSLELTSAMLKYVLAHPTRKPSPFARSRVNPYLTVLLTFLTTMLKHQKTREILERHLPWDDFAALFALVPRNVMASQGMAPSTHNGDGDRWLMLTSGTTPLPEDWCLRGMEWVGRKVFQPGYWKSDEERRAEIEILGEAEHIESTDGRIEDDDDNHSDPSETTKRWIRIVRCAESISRVVDGFTWIEGTRIWKVEGALDAKVRQWNEEDRIEKEEEERRRLGTRWADDSMDIDEDSIESFSDESEEDDNANDSDEIRALKVSLFFLLWFSVHLQIIYKERRRYLRNLLESETIPTRRLPRSPRTDYSAHPSLHIVPGYSVLVIDTNILLGSLSSFASLVESKRWTIMVPLPVIMELDGLKSNPSKLGEAAKIALDYITTHIRSHSISLKVQTSKGNYLTNLNVRIEQVDFSAGNPERSMDDLILKAAIWHDEHWVDRTTLLKADAPDLGSNPVKLVLLSLDRNRE